QRSAGQCFEDHHRHAFCLEQHGGRNESKGVCHRINFKVDHVRQEPKIDYGCGDSVVRTGTRITTPLPFSARSKPAVVKPRLLQIARGFGWLNPHLALNVAWEGELGSSAGTETPRRER